MIKVAVCEDEKILFNELEKCVEAYVEKNNLGISVDWFASAEEFLECDTMQFDIVFMDIKMIGMNGLEAARIIREKDNRIAIVFLTAFPDFALESYSVDASDYIVKPITTEKVARAFCKALGSIERKEQVLLVHFKGNVRKIFVLDILYIEAYRHKRYYYLVDGTVEEDIGTLKEIMNQDRKNEFMLIQKGCIVNKFWIERCQNQVIHMHGMENPLAVSRLRWKTVEKEYLLHCKSEIKKL